MDDQQRAALNDPNAALQSIIEARDEELDDTTPLFSMFANLCTFLQMEPADALAQLGRKDWTDSLLGSHIRQGF